LAVTAMIGVAATMVRMKHWPMKNGASTFQQKCRGDASCKGLNQIWGREGERGFVVASEGGWVCACVCVWGGA
jgi:hypothetical protein